MRCLIVASGDSVNFDFLKSEVAVADVVIAVDGGMDILAKANIVPTIWLGDMDSTRLDYQLSESIEIVKLNRDKDWTDLEAAIEFALQRRFTQIVITAVFGGRIDHFLTNISLLQKYSDIVKIKMLDEKQTVFLLVEENIIKVKKGSTFSLIPLTDLKGVTIKGAKYNTDNLTVELGSSICQSNLALSDKLEITINKGKALIVIVKEEKLFS